jgi:hypothetical protein
MVSKRAGLEAPSTEAISRWYAKASSVWGPLMFPETRFRTPWIDDEFAMTIQNARQWLRANPCPDPEIGRRCLAMLDAYAEMTTATVGRLMELRNDILENAIAVDRRNVPR